MRCAADIDEVGCPEFAAVVHLMLSTASCAAKSFQSCVRSSIRGSRSLVFGKDRPAYR